MSFSLKREIEFYVNDVDSTDGVQKLGVLPEFSLKLESSMIQVYRKIIGEDPEMLPRTVVDQISPIALEFITYLKPTHLDNLVGVTCPEKLLWDSLGGVRGYRDPEYYNPQFGRVNRLIPLFIFIKTEKAIYKINTAYVSGLEISLNIDYLLIGKWSVQAIGIEIFGVNEISFTNIKDYTNIDIYLRNKFTELTIKDHNLGKVYNFPITESNLKIVNSLMPAYDKNVKVRVGTPNDLLVGGRVVNGTLKCYFSSRKNYSVDFFKELYNDLTNNVIKKYEIFYSLVDGDKSISIKLPRAILNIPNLEFDDVLSATIEFTSSEKEYGTNDDIFIEYRKPILTFGYNSLINSILKPIYYYTFDTDGNTVQNYGSAGDNLDLVTSVGSANQLQPGNYTDNYSMYPNLAAFSASNPAGIVNSDELFVSLWFRPMECGSETYLLYYQPYNNAIVFNLFGGTCNQQNKPEIGLNICNTSMAVATVDITVTKPWHHIAFTINNITNKYTVYFDGVKVKNNLTFADSGYFSGSITIGDYTYNRISNTYLAEIIVVDKIPDNLDNLISTFYNSLSKGDMVFQNNNYTFLCDYNDTIIKYKGSSDYYFNVIKSYNAKAFWRFNDNDSTTVRDWISGKYPLDISNNPELGLDGPLLNDDKSKSVWFNRLGDGTLQYTTSTNLIPTTGITKSTYVFWVYIDNDNLLDGNYRQCLLRTNENPGSNFTLLKRAGGDGKVLINGIWYYYYTAGYHEGNYDCAYSFGNSFKIPLQIWTCIALTFNKTTNTLKTYVNGEYISTVTNSNVGVWWPASVGPVIGKITYNSSYRSTFRISEFAYFEEELSDISIQGIYAASGVTGFSYTITPSTTGNSLNVSGNTPSIARGQFRYPVKCYLNISGNIPKIVNIKNIYNSIGHIYTIYKIPIIKESKGVYPIYSSLNIVGNISEVNILKFVLPIKSRINIQKNTVNILKVYNVIKRSIGLVIKTMEYVRGNLKIISATNSTQEISGNIISIIKISKSVKPFTGHITIGMPKASEYFYEILNHSPEIQYIFDEEPGSTTLFDYSGYNRDATIYNNPTFKESGPHSNSLSTYFSKASLQHAIYNTAIPMPIRGTIAVWVKTNGQNYYDHIFQFNYAYNSGSNVNYFKLTNEGDYWIMPFASGWSGSWTMPISNNVWTHVVITWDSSINQISTYKNGVVVTNNGTHTSWPTSLQPLGICRGMRDGTTHYHNAWLNNFSLLSKRLSNAEVTTLYNKSTSILLPFDNVPVIQIVEAIIEPMAIIFI